MPEEINNGFGGTNQRIYPTLLPENTYTYTEGLVYRSGYGCRVNGKLLSTVIESPVVAMLQLPTQIIIQTLASVYSFPFDQLIINNLTLLTNDGAPILTNNEQFIYA